ncbi:TRAP transporter large permease [candidate division KSB1 bacterium]|nr:TRAP transporter large permease [candidate division KSB1 bacterium]RQW05565.1 MAG: TRAP transporter large permease [candidate division KSB1 bacterium]
MIWLLVTVFFLLAALRMQVAFALGFACAIAIVVYGDIPLAAIPHKLVNGIDSYVFLAIPLFLLAGNLMNAGGLTDRLFKFGRAMVGSIYGGLAHACVLASMLFAWMSGSAVATVGGLGEIEVKALTDNGYDKPFAAAVATSASVLGPIIPPSIPMIIYAAMTEQSVGKLFLGGIIPGLLMAGSLMVLIYLLSRKRAYPKDASTAVREKLAAFKEAFIPLLMPAIMLGGIVSGIFTPTEAAAVAALYALTISLFVYRTVKLKDLPRIFVEAMITSAVITFIISNTSAMSFLLTVEQAGIKIASAVLGFSSSRWVILLVVNILLLLFGALMEAGVVLILFIPILYPLVVGQYGVDPIHFGIIMCANLMIGVATPPVGVSLFVMTHVAKLKMERLMRAILPFLVPIIIILLLLTYIPQIVTFLPNMFMK